MSRRPDNVVKLSETLSLCEYTSPKSGHFGFWLYDTTRGMNLSMRAKTSTDAFVEALTYYQRRLSEMEKSYWGPKWQVDFFLSQFVEESEEQS